MRCHEDGNLAGVQPQSAAEMYFAAKLAVKFGSRCKASAAGVAARRDHFGAKFNGQENCPKLTELDEEIKLRFYKQFQHKFFLMNEL